MSRRITTPASPASTMKEKYSSNDNGVAEAPETYRNRTLDRFREIYRVGGRMSVSKIENWYEANVSSDPTAMPLPDTVSELVWSNLSSEDPSGDYTVAA